MQKNLTVKDLPGSERPYEKCMRAGAECLTDAELLAVIIRTGSQGERSVDLAYRILNTGPDGLLNLFSLSIADLTAIRGIGSVKAIQLKCIGEISRRIAQLECAPAVIMTDPGSIADYYMEQMRHLSKEHVMLVLFNSRQELLGDHVLTIGTSDCSLVSPPDIYHYALKEGAGGIVLLHNHPSGDPSPSENDLLVTEQVSQTGSLVGIPLVDHIIIGDKKYFSFREKGLLEEPI